MRVKILNSFGVEAELEMELLDGSQSACNIRQNLLYSDSPFYTAPNQGKLGRDQWGSLKEKMMSKPENSPISQKRRQKLVFRGILNDFSLSSTEKSDEVKPKRGHIKRPDNLNGTIITLFLKRRNPPLHLP
ncbi:hypothetical protein BTVI_22554 [Pitangus sulphuratus]|nr:hypothetical protein BTVI_22554 [Pitangus sulphuratus]